MEVREKLLYTPDHEWIRIDGDRITIGITDYAQDALGDVVFVDLPAVGDTITAGDAFGEVESTKSVSSIYSPVSGSVVEVNADVVDSPQLLNSEPYDRGWLVVINQTDSTEVKLMNSEEYSELVKDQ